MARRIEPELPPLTIEVDEQSTAHSKVDQRPAPTRLRGSPAGGAPCGGVRRAARAGERGSASGHVAVSPRAEGAPRAGGDVAAGVATPATARGRQRRRRPTPRRRRRSLDSAARPLARARRAADGGR